MSGEDEGPSLPAGFTPDAEKKGRRH
jgi:hypothetical protein